MTQMRVPDWLVKRSNKLIFPLNLADLSNEIDEILEAVGKDADSIVEDDIQEHCFDLLQARQRDIEHLSSLNLHKVIAKHMRASCRNEKSDETIDTWVKLKPEKAHMDLLVDEIANAVRAAWQTRTPFGEKNPKFSTLVLAGIDNFHHGLEKIIGYPPTHAKFLSSMRLEHDHERFKSSRKRWVHPKVEWNIVMRSDEWNIPGAGYEPFIEIADRKCEMGLLFYVDKAREKFAQADAVNDTLNEAEVAALRLWTGPMYEKYAEALRENAQEPKGHFVTTLHAINSAITKLARIWTIPVGRKVYRGYKGMEVEEMKKDEFNCVGGVEKCVLATSEDFNVAVNYSEVGAFILEIDVGQANRGADVSWLSQFPHEREILFNALSNIEFLNSPQQRIVRLKDGGLGKILIYQVRVSANLKSKTLNDFITLRRDLHLNLVNVLSQEAGHIIRRLGANSRYALIRRLCEQCMEQCKAIIANAVGTDVCKFNEGTSEYLRLVDDAVLFKSRSVKIINLALGWFEHGKVDPAEVQGLQDWQFEVLKHAFEFLERPRVSTIVLEQDRPVKNLFGAKTLRLGAVHTKARDTVFCVAKLLSLNPELMSFEVEIASATSDLWEQVFKGLCPNRPRLRVNGFHVQKYAIHTLQILELRNSGDQMATMIAPALSLYAPRALTSLNLRGTPIACEGAACLGRAFSRLPRLKLLDLRSCRIADNGCTGIALALAALSDLVELKLAHNNVGDEGFNVLASKISDLGLIMLQSVDLKFNITHLPSCHCGARCVIVNHMVSKLSTNARTVCVAWSPSGEHIASGSVDSTITVWDAKNGKKISTLKGHTHEVVDLAWSPGGDRIASASLDKSIITWNAETNKQILKFEGHFREVTSVAWNLGGDQIASGSLDRTIIIWDVQTAHQIFIFRGHTDWVQSVAWSPRGDQIISGSWDNTIFIWDSLSVKQVLSLKGHTNNVQSVDWSPSGDQIASGSADDTIIIWDAKTCNRFATLEGHTASVSSVAWSPGGYQLASGSWDNTIIIWNAKTWDILSTLKERTSDVTSVAWSPWGDEIVSASGDNGILRWDANTEDQVSNLKGHTGEVMSVAWSPTGGQIASGSDDNTIIIWNVKRGVASRSWNNAKQIFALRGHTGSVTSVEWSPRGDRIASGSHDKTIIVWNAKTGLQDLMFEGHTDYVNSVVWSPGGDRIASGSWDNLIIIWDVKTRDKVSTLIGHTQAVTSIAWRPRADEIASGSSDGSIIIWDTKTEEQQWSRECVNDDGDNADDRSDYDHDDDDDNDDDYEGKASWQCGRRRPVYYVAWSPGGDQIASSFYGETIAIWDLDTGNQLVTLEGHTEAVTSVAWCPGGSHIASGSDDGTIIIWDAKTFDLVAMLKGHTREVTSVAWSPEGDRIASGSRDRTIIVWDTKSGDLVSRLIGHNDPVDGARESPSRQQTRTVPVSNEASGAMLKKAKNVVNQLDKEEVFRKKRFAVKRARDQFIAKYDADKRAKAKPERAENAKAEEAKEASCGVPPHVSAARQPNPCLIHPTMGAQGQISSHVGLHLNCMKEGEHAMEADGCNSILEYAPLDVDHTTLNCDCDVDGKTLNYDCDVNYDSDVDGKTLNYDAETCVEEEVHAKEPDDRNDDNTMISRNSSFDSDGKTQAFDAHDSMMKDRQTKKADVSNDKL